MAKKKKKTKKTSKSKLIEVNTSEFLWKLNSNVQAVGFLVDLKDRVLPLLYHANLEKRMAGYNFADISISLKNSLKNVKLLKMSRYFLKYDHYINKTWFASGEHVFWLKEDIYVEFYVYLHMSAFSYTYLYLAMLVKTRTARDLWQFILENKCSEKSGISNINGLFINNI